MEIKILVPENEKANLDNFIKCCEYQGFKVVREGGGKLPTFSGYFAELKGDKWGDTKTALDLADAQFVGFREGKWSGSIIPLVESMGLTKSEWETWKTNYPNMMNESDYQQIEEHFRS